MSDRVKLSDLPELEAAIVALGPDDATRAAALGFTDRALRLWKSEGMPPLIMRFLARPELAAALARAAENNRSVISEIAS